MLSSDLAIFEAIYSTHGSLWRYEYLKCVFPWHFVATLTTPSQPPYVITCGTGKKLSKMAGNSASKPLNSTPNELLCITVEWWRIVWEKARSSMHSRDTQHLIFQIGISKYL